MSALLGSLHRPYTDRADAGRRLATVLAEYRRRRGVLVLGIPRGGVPVAYEVAGALSVPLDVVVVRKLGLPSEPELAMGAIASGGTRVLNRDIVDALGISNRVVDAVAERELAELVERERRYRGDRPTVKLASKTVILVDDGMATGASMRAAVVAVRSRGARRVIAAVPVAARSTCLELAHEADDVVCPLQVEAFGAVGQWYDDFSQTTDEEVRDLLERSRRPARVLAAP